MPEINSKDMRMRQFAERTAINAPVQGSAADLIKAAMIDIHNELKKKKLTSSMILQVHDELVFEVPETELDTVKDLVRDKMENAIRLDVPVKVNIDYGKNWLQMQPVN